MEYGEAMRAAMRARGWTRAQVAEAAGVSEAAVGSMLRKGNPSVRAMLRYLAPMGYRVAVVPVGARLPEGSYELGGAE